MKPLPNLPDRDRPPDQTASRAVWSIVFIGLGVTILANLPPEDGLRWIIVAMVSFAAAAYFLFLLLVRKDHT
jgi:hypothetical protein